MTRPRVTRPTDRQVLALRCIFESIRDRGFPPTLREIGAVMGIRSTNGVNDHLRALERKKLITRSDMLSRSLRLTHEGARAAMQPSDSATAPACCPLCGQRRNPLAALIPNEVPEVPALEVGS